jgi:hypothetical protein
VPRNATVDTTLVAGGRATFRVTTPLGPARGIVVGAAPDNPLPALPAFANRAMIPECRGSTDVDGVVTLTPFPPGPAQVNVHLPNSIYKRSIAVPPDGHELAVVVPDGFQPVHVVSAGKGDPVGGALVTWMGGGSRVEATVTFTGDALLEGVGIAPGALSVESPRYERFEEQVNESPGLPRTVVLKPRPITATTLRSRVLTTSGQPLPNAVVELVSADQTSIPHVAVTDASGAVTFTDVPAGACQLIASARGFATSWTRVAEIVDKEIVMTLGRGYRVNVETTSGPYGLRILNEVGESLDDLLDLDSDRTLDAPGHASVGPLAPGAYVIELSDAAGRRRTPVRIVDRDVVITLQ